jgi:hypothetical protein
VRLRIVIEADRILCQTCDDDFLWVTAKAIDRKSLPGAPTLVRFGKTGSLGKPEDYATPGDTGTCSVSDIKVWGTI